MRSSVKLNVMMWTSTGRGPAAASASVRHPSTRSRRPSPPTRLLKYAFIRARGCVNGLPLFADVHRASGRAAAGERLPNAADLSLNACAASWGRESSHRHIASCASRIVAF